MAHKSNRKARKLSDEAEQDFAAPADQWIDQDWHLPPGGDHSWREREVQRIFGGVVEEPINDKADPPPLEQIGPTSDEMDGSYEPGFRRGRALSVLLAVP